MRLTLRTMLAYLDNALLPPDSKVLAPADAEALGKKINESDFASGLVQRVKAVLKKVQEIDEREKGMFPFIRQFKSLQKAIEKFNRI